MKIKLHTSLIAQLILLIFAVAGITVFQSCGQTGTSVTPNNGKTTKRTSTGIPGIDFLDLQGNGDGYDGKPTYINYDLDGDCTGQTSGLPAEKSVIEVQGASLVKTRDNCQDLQPPQVVQTSQVSIAEYNPNFLVYSEAVLYQSRLEIDKGTISTTLCRGSDDANFALSSHFIDVNVYEKNDGSGLLMNYSIASYGTDFGIGLDLWSILPPNTGERRPTTITFEDSQFVEYSTNAEGILYDYGHIALRVNKITRQATFYSSGLVDLWTDEQEMRLQKCYFHAEGGSSRR